MAIGMMGGNRDMFRGMDDRGLKKALDEAARFGNYSMVRQIEAELSLRLNEKPKLTNRDDKPRAAASQLLTSNQLSTSPNLTTKRTQEMVDMMRQYTAAQPGTIWQTDGTGAYGVNIPRCKTLRDKFKTGDYVELTADKKVGIVYRVYDNHMSVTVGEGESKQRVRAEEKDVVKLNADQIAAYTAASKVHFDSVIMSDEHREAIIDALKQVSLSDLIFEEWGFKETMEKGKAISFLFYGEPGTGKTLTAQAIADYLGKKLEVIGTGEIQSSEPGQAERNIKAYFEKAGNDKVLLFDECDSLVHSRNNTGSIMAAQINSLLTALEHYEGVVMFTTNRLGVLDEAFNRRLSLKLEFPMPTVEQRLEIWKRMFPKKAPLDKDIAWDKLAALELTGGYIKNIVLRAVRSAAAQGHKKITYEVLKKAAIHEVNSKREFEAAARQQRRGGVTTVDQAIKDYGIAESTTQELTRSLTDGKS